MTSHDVVMTNDVTIMAYIHNEMAVQCTQRWLYIRVHNMYIPRE